MSNNCLNSNEERLERTATSSSVTRSGTRRENAFFFRIAIRAKSIACFSQTAAVFFPFLPAGTDSAEMARPGSVRALAYGVGVGLGVGCGVAGAEALKPLTAAPAICRAPVSRLLRIASPIAD